MSNFSNMSWQEFDEMKMFALYETDALICISLKQQSAGRHVAPLRHIILIASQQVFALSP